MIRGLTRAERGDEETLGEEKHDAILIHLTNQARRLVHLRDMKHGDKAQGQPKLPPTPCFLTSAIDDWTNPIG